jgi:GNAT superfamily N-acetyltransferase
MTADWMPRRPDAIASRTLNGARINRVVYDITSRSLRPPSNGNEGRSVDRVIERSGEVKAGTPAGVRPFESGEDVDWAAGVMAGSEPWITLGRGYEASRVDLSDQSKERFLLTIGDDRAGFLILNMAGAFAGYIQTICVAPAFRKRGFGTLLMGFAEERVFRHSPNVFLCVSSSNPDARRLYERLGYIAGSSGLPGRG